MSTSQPEVPRSRARRRRRVAALGAATGLALGGMAIGAGTASAAPVSLTGVSFEWGLSVEAQSSNPAPNTCPYFSAGQSDGTQASYQTTAGNVSVVKDGTAPTWATKCDGAATRSINQTFVFSEGTGTADPATGAATISFTGAASVNFYSGMVPFTIVDPVLTVGADGDGTITADLVGYASSIDNPGVKTPLPPVEDVVIADLTGVDVAGSGFTVTPDYAGVILDAPEGQTPQNRTTTGWGSWPASFVDFQFDTGLSAYWYSSGGAADPYKAPTALTFSYADIGDGTTTTTGGTTPTTTPSEPGEGQQVITAEVPEPVDPGEFLWSITGDSAVDLGQTTDQGTYLQATGEIDPISVTDTRTGGPAWSIAGQVSDFTGGVDGKHLGWTPKVLVAGAGATAGAPVAPGITTGDGLKATSTLASATAGHDAGTASVGADLDLRLPVETAPGTYSATLTITALS